MRPEKYVLLGMGIVIAILIGFLVGRRCHVPSPGETPAVRVDTLVIRDTLKVTEPKYITRRVVDSVPIPVIDTIRCKDTLYVVMEMEQVIWEDSLARVYASGISPQVDSVIHFTQDQIIIKEIPLIQVKKTRWGVGIQGGVTANKDGLQPYVGLGLSYNILSW